MFLNFGISLVVPRPWLKRHLFSFFTLFLFSIFLITNENNMLSEIYRGSSL